MQRPAGQTSKQYFSLLTLLHAALLGVQVLVAIVFYYITSTGNSALAGDASAQDLDDIFQFIVPAFVVVSYIGSSVLVKSQLKALQAKTSLREKLDGYVTVLLMRFALLEFPSLFAMVCFFLTSNYVYLGLAGLIMVVFLTHRPTLYRMVDDLQLTAAERSVLENPEAVIS